SASDRGTVGHPSQSGGPRRSFIIRPSARAFRSSIRMSDESATPFIHPSICQMVPLQPGQSFKFTVLETLDRIKEEFQFLQAQYHSLKLECEKLASEKTEMQRHYIMVSSIGPLAEPCANC
ncbi:unnamed protein product, partial [Menidia menidia]